MTHFEGTWLESQHVSRYIAKRAQFTSLLHCPRSKCMLRLYSTVAGFESRHCIMFPPQKGNQTFITLKTIIWHRIFFEALTVVSIVKKNPYFEKPGCLSPYSQKSVMYPIHTIPPVAVIIKLTWIQSYKRASNQSGSQNIFFTFYGTKWFFTLFTGVRHWILLRDREIS